MKNLDDYRPLCRCKPWAQRWRPDRPEACVTCGGMFPTHTVDARRPGEAERWARNRQEREA